MAERLVVAGVQPGDLVGLCLDRSAALVVSALGILRAGAAYVAIDPAYPDERIRWMLDDSGSAAVVTDAGGVPRLGPADHRPLILVSDGGLVSDSGAPPSVREPAHPVTLPSSPSGSDVAYVVYTSGSTGQPKGVLVEHGSLANLVAWHRTSFDLGPDDRGAQISSPGFDAAVWEIWPYLAAGAAIDVVPEAVRTDPVGLRDWLVAAGITVTFLPTVVAEAVIGLVWPADAALRTILTGGDALMRRPRPELGFTLVNNYGLSETAVVATSGVVTSDGDGPPSIGRPITGVVVDIVDADLRPVEPGAAGELLVGGVAVARAYLNRPELTAERFLEAGRSGRSGHRRAGATAPATWCASATTANSNSSAASTIS